MDLAVPQRHLCWPIECKWPPSEIDEYYGVIMAALATGAVPGEYRQTPQAGQGLEKIRTYLRQNRAATPYQCALLLWTSRYLPDVLSETEKKERNREGVRAAAS